MFRSILNIFTYFVNIVFNIHKAESITTHKFSFYDTSVNFLYIHIICEYFILTKTS
jgi:hypothetical protein